MPCLFVSLGPDSLTKVGLVREGRRARPPLELIIIDTETTRVDGKGMGNEQKDGVRLANDVSSVLKPPA